MSSMRRNTGRDRRGGQRIFSPLQLMGGIQAAWYRADRGVTGSPSITALADQSGQGYDLAVNVNSPTLVTDGGLPAIRLSGASAQQLRRAAPTGAFAYTLAVCVKIDTNAVVNNFVFGVFGGRGCNVGANSANHLIRHASIANITGGAVDTANYKTIIATGGDASPFTPKLWVNNVLQTNTPFGNQTYLNATGTDFISIGTGAASAQAYLREAIWLDRRCTDIEAAQLHTYLSAWGVA